MRAGGGKKCRQAAASRVCAPTGGMLCAGAALRFSPLALRSPSARPPLALRSHTPLRGHRGSAAHADGVGRFERLRIRGGARRAARVRGAREMERVGKGG